MKILVIISYYSQREINSLLHLIKQIKTIQAGYPFDLKVVCNADNFEKIDKISLLEKENIPYIIRENKGFNIGAWDQGWRRFSDYDYYLFLQDDCFIIRPQWLKAFVEQFTQTDQIGLLGESLNWEVSWDELANSSYNQIHREHFFNDQPIKRVDFYRIFLQNYQIPEGKTAEHLQSIVLFTSRSILEQINGFIIGQNYGEAIASEIAISKQVQRLGYQIKMVNPQSCYYYIAHPQWFLRKRRIDRYLYLIRSQLHPIYKRPILS